MCRVEGHALKKHYWCTPADRAILPIENKFKLVVPLVLFRGRHTARDGSESRKSAAAAYKAAALRSELGVYRAYRA